MSANSQDIRAWAVEQGIELGRRGAIPKTVADRYEAEHNGGPPAAGDDTPMVILPDGPQTPAEPPEPPVTPEPPPAERAPVAPRQDRRGLLSRKAPAAAGKTRKTPPRVSVADLAGMAYSGIGYVLSRNPVLVPAARSMDIMAPVAGELIDEQIKGTVVDRLVQPLARGSERGKVAVALAGFPVCVAAASYHPEWMPTLRPVMKMCLMVSMEVSVPAQRKIEQRIEKMAEDFGGVDFDAMIDAVFATVPVDGVPSSAEEAAIRKARGELR